VKKIHIEICLNAEEPLYLPIHYNHIIQAVILNSIDSDLADFLHNIGYSFKERTFKMYTFSRLNGAFYMDRANGRIVFENKLKLIISSPLDKFCHSFANVLLSKGKMRLGNKEVQIERVRVIRHVVQGESVVVKTLSPVVAYSTLYKADGRKYTCYFQPGEPDYNDLIDGNLRRKYVALYKEEPPEGKVKVISKGRTGLNIVKYKGFIIKGCSGRLLLQGPGALLQVGIDAGLGSKNSQGFGCIEIIGRGGEGRC
jgi:CRISPR-associated endoribonuclease Cas6